MVCSEGVNGAGAVAILLLMQHAAYLPTSKNLPHVIDLLSQHIYFSFASNKQVSNEKYQLLCHCQQ